MDNLFYPISVQDTSDSLTSVIELSVSCRNLLNKDVFSKSDPMCVLYIEKSNSFKEFGRTEVVKDNLNPDFLHKFILEYHFEEQQRLKFELYDVDSSSQDLDKHDFLGEHVCTLGEIVAYQGAKLEKILTGRNDCGKYGSLFLVAEEVRLCKNIATFHFTGMGLKKQSFFSSLKPFITILKKNNDESYSIVYKTEVSRGTQTWKITIPLTKLCNGIYDRPLRVQCYNWSISGNHHLIGEFNTDFHKLSVGPGDENTYECINIKKKQKSSNYKNSGILKMTSFELKEEVTFVDYIKGGTQINCTVAVDFTASNGDPKSPASLHYAFGSFPNPYVTAIRAVVEILEDYDSDKMFPALGFGAKLPNGQVSHEFFLNSHPSNPYCMGAEGVLDAYYKSIRSVKLHGPTNFSPVIKHVTRFAEDGKDGRNYFILLIITDGVISDMAATKEAIIYASNLPLSIIIVGVGDADFSAMNELDADDTPLCINKRYAARDIVQFVPFNEIWSKDDWVISKVNLAKAVLAEIPGQFISFMKVNNIQPNVILPSNT